MQFIRTLAFVLCLLFAWNAAAQTAVPASRDQITLSFAPIVKKVTPAVVNIYTKRHEQVTVSPFMNDPFFRQFFGGQLGPGGISRDRIVRSLGSGVVVNEQGQVVTSNHVIENSDDIVVVLADGREFQARVQLQDPMTDLALLTLQDTKGARFAALPVANSDTLQVGDLVLAVGNPFGVGQTVTSGIVSALARSAKGVSDYGFFIQTDAAVNPGNSGGALVNMRGELAGINTAIYTASGGSVGIGFAIPSNIVQVLLRNQGSGIVVKPWLGASLQDVTPQIADAVQLSVAGGAVIANVLPGSPAAQAGLQPGDIVLAFNDLSVSGADGLRFRLATADVRQPVKLTVYRDGRTFGRSVTLTLPPEIPPRDGRVLKGNHPLNGVMVMNLSPRVAEELGMDSTLTGVVIANTNGPSGFGGVQKGDIVDRINGKPVASTRELAALLEGNASGDWDMVLRRGTAILNFQVRR